MGVDGLVLAPVVLFLLVYNFSNVISGKDNREDINKLQNHTHAADGSINGIRGWY
jgi:hypothetical protein